jgi:branched-subunit amino acid aminotransferase/4-amino-4-deoxychorismate lyase
MTAIAARAWVDGDPQAGVSPFDGGFLYGDAVFETVRAIDGRAIELEAHLDLLAHAAAALELPLPGRDRLVAALAPALATAGDQRLRLIVTRGAGAGATVVVTAEPRVAPPAALTVAVVDHPLGDPRTLDPALKTGAYLPNLRALRAGQRRGADEALRRDRAGRIATGATSNLIAIVAGRVVAPPRAAGIRPGVTRARVLALAGARGLVVEERDLDDAELVGADGLLIASSIRGVVPVGALVLAGPARQWSGPDPIGAALVAAYDQYVAEVATRAAG